MSDYDQFQNLMDKAYDIWQANPNLTTEQFIESVNEKHRPFVAFGKLNQQVENGGFQQYYDNGYNVMLKYAISMVKMLRSEESKKVLEILREVKVLYRQLDNKVQRNKHYGIDDHLSDLYEFNSLCKFDDQYYELNDKVMDEIESYIKDNNI